jgi:hypothetical protein
MLRDINLYGTGSNLFDVHGAYKKNITQVMSSKKRDKEEILVRVTTVPRHLINPNGTFK